MEQMTTFNSQQTFWDGIVPPYTSDFKQKENLLSFTFHFLGAVMHSGCMCICIDCLYIR